MVGKTALRIVGVLLVVGGILEGLTMILYASDAVCTDCQPMFGSYLALLSSIVTIINGVLTWRLPEVIVIEDDDFGAVSYDYDVEVLKANEGQQLDQHTGSSDEEDGVEFEYSPSHYTDANPKKEYKRRQIVKTIVNNDGTHMIEETTMIPEI